MILGQKNSITSSWSRNDDLAFERALGIYTEETESRWEKIVAVVPGKTLEQIKEHYEILVHDVMMIEYGCVPPPDYDVSEEPDHNSSDKERSIWEHGNNHKSEFKIKPRKGIPWTSKEHRNFLLGLEQYGKGDWRSISRNCVLTRTPAQIASHAQKYFAHLNSKNRKRKRASIHDITIADNMSMSTKQGPITWQNKNNNVVVTSNTQTAFQPSLGFPVYGTSNIWNTQATQTILQPSLDYPTYGAPTIWNTQAALQPTINMVEPMFLPSGTGMNYRAPPHMTNGIQHHLEPYPSVPSASLNMGSVSYNMNYIPDSGI